MFLVDRWALVLKDILIVEDDVVLCWHFHDDIALWGFLVDGGT